MEDRLMKRREVAKITGLSLSTIYRQMPKCQFSRQVSVGLRAVGWRASEVYAWIKSRPSAQGEDGGLTED